MSLSMGQRTHSVLLLACIALAAGPPLLAATTFDRTSTFTLYLGFAVPILIAEASVVLAALVSGLRPVSALLRLSRPTQIAILVWVSAITYVNFMVAPFGLGARVFVLVMLLHGLFALALVDRLSSGWAGEADRLLLSVGWGALAYCVLAYGLLLTVRNVSEFNWLSPGVGVSHVRQFGFYGITCAAAGAGLAASMPSANVRLRDLSSFLFVAVGGGMCLWSGGRAAAGAFVLTLALAVAISAPGTRMRVTSMITAAAAAAIALSIVWLPHETYGLPRILNTVQPNGVGGLRQFTSNRTQMWIETLQLWSERPLLGYGMGQFKFLVPSALFTYTHPHNALIQFLFQWGLVGTAAVLVMSRKAMVEYVVAIRLPGSPAGKIAVCLLTGHGAMSMLEGNLAHIYPVSIVLLALAVLGARSSKSTRRKPKKPGICRSSKAALELIKDR